METQTIAADVTIFNGGTVDDLLGWVDRLLAGGALNALTLPDLAEGGVAPHDAERKTPQADISA